MLKNYLKSIYRKYWTWRCCITLGRKPVDIRVNGRSYFTSNMDIGTNCHFNGMRVEGRGRVTIGDNFHSGREVLLITDVHNYRGTKLPYDETYIVKDITIGDNVWVGTRVTILGGVTIGEGAIIQAGAVVVSDVEPLAIVGGAPAQKFSERNNEHYWQLVSLRAFH